MDDATTANSSSPVNSSSSNHENGTRDNRNEPLVPSTSTSSWFGGFFSSPLNDKNPAATATSATVVSTSPSSHSTFTDRNTSTTTVASDNGSSYSSSSSSSRGQSKKGLLSTLASAIAPSTAGEDDDPFDDEGNLSADEIESRRQTQKEQLSTRTGCLQPITHRVPSYIPPNIPATELATPETIVTVLNNGIRVVSQETYGQVSTVGMVSDFGSRYETVSNHTTGITHLLELTAFGACSGGGGCSGRSGYRSSSEVAHQLQEWGGTRFVSTGREQSIHCIDLLRPNVGQAVGMLSDVLLRPQFLESELDEARMAIQFQSLPEHTPPELLLTEALQKAAYGSHQQLGQPHFCTEEYSPHLTRTAAVQYWHDQFLANPHGMVVGGAGVNHDEFVTLVDRHFGHLLPQPLLNEASDANQSSRRVRSIPSQYQGGECLVPLPALMTEEEGNNEDGSSSSSNAAPVSVVTAEQRLTRVALALEVPGGWHSDDLVVACVLQTLLGGGSSFSAGGPGKGMYSRLYRQVLNQYRWAESAEAFTAFHSESGLFGISGSTPADKAPDMIHVFCRHLALLALEPVSQPELDRARNMLKNNVLTQLESRLILFEDMSRQVLTYGKREDIRETCEKINAVTAADIKAAVQRALSKPPTLAAVGVDLGSVPNFEQVELWLQQ